MFSGSESHNLDSVATAAEVVGEAIVLMSVHEGGANVGRSIQAENAEASSLLLLLTNLSDKEQWERPRPARVSRHQRRRAIKADLTIPGPCAKKPFSSVKMNKQLIVLTQVTDFRTKTREITYSTAAHSCTNAFTPHPLCKK